MVEKRKEAEWKEGGAQPAHHANDSASRFQNPWPSFRCVRHCSPRSVATDVERQTVACIALAEGKLAFAFTNVAGS